MKLPIGYSNFREIIDNKLDFVDKSLFIRAVLDNSLTKVAVITRPRRFGKTLNLSMLHHFFAAETYGRPTTGLFDHLKISQAGEAYMQQQGKYPVVFVSFKDIKDHSFDVAIQMFVVVLSEIYGQHRYLLSSPHLYEEDKVFFELMLKQQITSPVQLAASLKNLTRYLFQHHGTAAWLLIDEYDTPIQSAYVSNYLDEMMAFMRNIFGSTLKDNPYLHRSVITGILNIAKENLFSGLNNLEVYTLLQSTYAEYFGFTENEIIDLLEQSKMMDSLPEIRKWYNGYQAGEIVLYNPWSMVNYFKNKEFAPYWVNTSDNELIRNLIIHSKAEFKEQFVLLLQDKPIVHQLDERMIFADLKMNSKAPWSLLFAAGYLKVTSYERSSEGVMCVLKTPNLEVCGLYRQIIKTWLANGHGVEWYNAFLDNLLKGNMESFEQDLQQIMEQTVSVHDVSHDPEAFYHGFILGLTAGLYDNKNYQLLSNRESGYGRYDYMIFSQDKNKPTILLEFKRVDSHKNTEQLEKNLIKAAEGALEQIDQKNYLAIAKQKGCTDILKIALAFSGKRFKLCHERITEQQTDLTKLSVCENEYVYGVNPNDILADGNDTGEFHGLTVRKGTIKAAIENAKILESTKASRQEKQAAKEMLKQLAPHIVALELNQHVVWKNPEIQALFGS